MIDEVIKLVDLGDYEYKCKNYSNAYDYYKKGIELNSDHAYLWFRRSLAALRLNNVQEFVTGFEKAKSLADGDLYSEIESTFILEKILIHKDAIESRYRGASESAYDHMAEVRKFSAGEEVVKDLHKILDLRNDLRKGNKYSLINDMHGIKVMKEIYQILLDIEKYRNAFGKYESLWRRTVGMFVVPSIDNTAAWLNFKLSNNDHEGLSSLIIMTQRRLG